MRAILLITNAAAGTHDADALADAVAVLRRDADVEVTTTARPADLDAALAERAGRDVVVAGGDGSLHVVVAALRRRQDLAGTTLGLIPLGTGNDFARGVRIPLAPARAADVVAHGRRARIDLLVDDEGGVVVNAVHSGVGAEAGREAKPWTARFGKVGYAVGAVLAGFRTRGDHVRVTADRTVVADGRRRVLQVGIGNGSYIGGGTPLTPRADPTDGEVDVIVSFAVRRRDRLLYAVHLKRGTHAERHDVQTMRATWVEISGEPFSCNADGELTGPVRHRRWDLTAGAFSLMLPTPDQAEPGESEPAESSV